jgi:hypothetical protein
MNTPATIGGVTTDTIQAMAITLLRNIPRIRQREDAADILAAITQATRNAQRTIDRPPPRVYAGPCPHTRDDGTPCGTDLLAEPGRSIAYCRTCGEPSVVAERQEAMRDALQDYLYTSTEMSKVLVGLGCPNVTSSVVRGLVYRRRVVPHGMNQSGHALYRVGDVLDLVLRG